MIRFVHKPSNKCMLGVTDYTPGQDGYNSTNLGDIIDHLDLVEVSHITIFGGIGKNGGKFSYQIDIPLTNRKRTKFSISQ